MINLKKVELDDRDYLTEIFTKQPDRGCEYSFGSLYMWGDVYQTTYSKQQQGAVVCYKSLERFLFPAGSTDLKQTIDDIFEYFDQINKEFCLMALRTEDCEQLETMFPGKFKFELDEKYSEYVYNSLDLIELKGKKYHAKRNHISRFKRENENYSFVEFTKENIDRVIEMNHKWCEKYGCKENDGLSTEYCATTKVLKNFFSLPFDGAFIETNGEIVAFAVGEKLTNNTYCVHIEKAFHEINGSYATINRDFAERYAKDYKYINREDAAGEEGLIKAKLSYYPCLVTEKFIATLKEE